MSESFDAYRYIGYLRSRWRWIAASAALAVGLAAAASLAMTPQYTATARLVIEPPAGADLRAAMAVSPIYLESLKTYEHFADSDSLFQKAVQQFGLAGQPIESLKRRVLQVQLVRNTRILEISVTLPDAEEGAGAGQVSGGSHRGDQSRSRFRKATRICCAASSSRRANCARDCRRPTRPGPRRSPPSRCWACRPRWSRRRNCGRRSRSRRRARNWRSPTSPSAPRPPPTPAELRKQESNARARLVEMRKQMQELDRQGAEREKLLATRQAHRDQLDAERKAGQASLAAMEARLRDARGETGFRGERLKIIDPGIVPERPSSPNLPLNVAAALLAGLVLPILYLTLEMSFQGRRAALARGGFRAVAKARDE